VGPTRLWPPNHRTVEGTVVAHDNAHPAVSYDLTVLGMDNDTNEESDFGGGAAASDSTGTASTPVHFARERTGQAKAGRTYTIRAEADFDAGTNSCVKYFCVIVPHDMRQENRTVGCTPTQFTPAP
ncbi:MAG: hypothetical protein QOD30_257, partial [Actinomycetota bacterium]|nr:hypothetical protein [Actinomycetota bacterium]